MYFRSSDEALCVDRKVQFWCSWGVPSTVLTGFLSINEPQAFGKDFDHHFGKGGSELLDMKASDFDAIATSLLSKMKKNHKEPGNLKECSPWMSEFKVEFLRNELEVPGKFPSRADGDLSLRRKLLLLSFTSYVGYMALLSGLTQRQISSEISLFIPHLLNLFLSCSPDF